MDREKEGVILDPGQKRESEKREWRVKMKEEKKVTNTSTKKRERIRREESIMRKTKGEGERGIEK